MTETVPQAVDTPAPDANANPEAGSEAAPSPAVKPADNDVTEKVRSRIDELTRYRREAERERDYFRSEVERLRTQPPPKPAEPAAQAKTLADFNYDEADYQAYLREEVAKTTRETLAKELQTQREQEDTARRRRTFKQREAEFAKETPDYREIAYHAPITDEVAQLVTELESGPHLAYFLGKNPEVAAAISELPLRIAAVELGRIDARLTAEREKAKATPPVSKAPPPPAKLEGSGDPKVEKDPSEMTDVEFAKWRKRQIAQRR
jgi:hypothetical protein